MRSPPFTRRALLCASVAATLLPGALLPGCSPPPEPIQRFLLLSRRLLGREDLDAGEAAALHAALSAGEGAQARLDQLAARLQDEETLSAEDERTRLEVLRGWYAGVVLGPDGLRRRLFPASLPWTAMGYGAPRGLCHDGPALWGAPPPGLEGR